MQLPQDIYNRALDALGVDTLIGAFTDGTPASEAGRRAYGPTLRQLLGAAQWPFARKLAPLQLLGDSTGQTLDALGNPLPTTVEPPWVYAYAWPIDGLRARWLPWSMAATTPSTAVPIMTGLQSPVTTWPLKPARFLVSSSDQFPAVVGQTDWDNLPDFSSTEGVGNIGRRVVLANVQNAQLVYTKLVLTIEEWDEMFTEAMVATLASRVVMALHKDKKLALTLRGQQIAIAKEMVREARTANANDAGFPKSTTIEASWMRYRTGRYASWNFPGWGTLGDGPGYWSMGWDSVAWADGSIY